MPLHRLYVPPTLYTDTEKAALAEAITKLYSRIPPFYVVVLFIEVPEQNYFVSGKPTKNFVRFVVHHMARQFDGDVQKRNFMDRYEAALEPFTKGKNVDWEVQVADMDPVLWNENGIRPPPPNSEAEDTWKALNRPVPYEL
ncbi:putative oxalocrotonate tautomerase [Mycena floridula]|nr:putative oxalocrotonate tautomerase [Mycena floridula]